MSETTLKSHLNTKPWRLVSDTLTILQMGLMGLLMFTDVLSLPLLSFYVPAMAMLVASGIAGIINSTQRIYNLLHKISDYKNDDLKNKPTDEYKPYEKAHLAHLKREIFRHCLKIALIEVPCLTLGVVGLVTATALTAATMYNILLLTNAALTLGSLIFATWNGIKLVHEIRKPRSAQEKKENPQKRNHDIKVRAIKFMAAVVMFLGSTAGLALTIVAPQALLPAGVVLVATFFVMATYLGYNGHKMRQKALSPNPVHAGPDTPQATPVSSAEALPDFTNSLFRGPSLKSNPTQRATHSPVFDPRRTLTAPPSRTGTPPPSTAPKTIGHPPATSLLC